jgi:hypothetical protein
MSKLFESKRIVIATIGSLGDLHPCLALALELMLYRKMLLPELSGIYILESYVH